MTDASREPSNVMPQRLIQVGLVAAMTAAVIGYFVSIGSHDEDEETLSQREQAVARRAERRAFDGVPAVPIVIGHVLHRKTRYSWSARR